MRIPLDVACYSEMISPTIERTRYAGVGASLVN